MLTGASDLRTEAARGPDGASSSPPAEPKSDGGTTSEDGSSSEDAPTSGRIREITFESGSVTGMNGGDTATGTPFVTTDGALRGKYSMVVGGPKAFIATTFTGEDEIYASFTFAVAMFPEGDAAATIARIGFASPATTLDFSVRARGLVMSVGGASIAVEGVIGVGAPYRLGVHLVQAGDKMTIESFLVEGATGSFGASGGPRIVTGSAGLINRIELGSLGAESLTAVFDQLLIDSLAMPLP